MLMIYPFTADIVDTLSTVNTYFLGFILSICGLNLAYGGYLWLTSGDIDPEQAQRGKRYVVSALVGGGMVVLASIFSSALLHGISSQPPSQPTSAPQPPSLPTDLPPLTPLFVVGALVILLAAVATITYRLRKREEETETSDTPTLASGSSSPLLPTQTAVPALPEPGLKRMLLTPEMRGHLLDEALAELAERSDEVYRSGQWDTTEYGSWADALNQAKVEIDNDALFAQAKKDLSAYAVGEIDEDQFQQRLQRLQSSGKAAMQRRARAIYRAKAGASQREARLGKAAAPGSGRSQH